MLGQLRKEVVNPNKPANYQSLGSQSHVVMQTDLVEEEEEDDQELHSQGAKAAERVEPKSSESEFKEPGVSQIFQQKMP